MKRFLILLISILSVSSFYGCRETVPPETLEEEATEKDSMNVNQGRYNNESETD